ncbi:MAG: hypothetical protein RL274_2687, partial [Pseudomonadota bacterium]
ALRFRYAPPTAGHSAGGWNALTIKTDHPVEADHACDISQYGLFIIDLGIVLAVLRGRLCL